MAWQTALLIVLPLVAGALIPIQTGANRMVAVGLENPLLAAGTSMAIAAVVLITVGSMAIRPGALQAAIPSLPLWAWTGGLLGACFVTGAIIVAPRIGATNYLLLVFVGQMIMSTVTDGFGLFGFAQRPISLLQAFGIIATLFSATIALWQVRP